MPRHPIKSAKNTRIDQRTGQVRKPMADSRDFKTEQMDDIIGNRMPSDFIRADSDVIDPEYAKELAFMEEPVTVQIGSEMHENAPQHVFCQVNGKGMELRVGDRWVACDWVPVDQMLTTKRKYIEVLLRAKTTKVRTDYIEGSQIADTNRIIRTTNLVNNVAMIEDANPRGLAWFREMLRRAA